MNETNYKRIVQSVMQLIKDGVEEPQATAIASSMLCKLCQRFCKHDYALIDAGIWHRTFHCKKCGKINTHIGKL